MSAPTIAPTSKLVTSKKLSFFNVALGCMRLVLQTSATSSPNH